MLKEELKFENTNIFEGIPSISAVIKSIESGISTRKILTVFIDAQKRISKSRKYSRRYYCYVYRA